MRPSRLLENLRNSEEENLGYGDCMKIKQIIAVIIMLAGVACFWLESADRSQADWKIDALGILLVLFGLWVGKFNLKRPK
jgi:hypothetical protein